MLIVSTLTTKSCHGQETETKCGFGYISNFSLLAKMSLQGTHNKTKRKCRQKETRKTTATDGPQLAVGV